MSKISDRLRKLADDMMAVDGDLNLTPGSINPEEAADLLDEAEKALVEALLWTDEEYDVGEWRDKAIATLARIRGEQP
jgi:hypothetical protein